MYNGDYSRVCSSVRVFHLRNYRDISDKFGIGKNIKTESFLLVLVGL
jgi:hypothetical protein